MSQQPQSYDIEVERIVPAALDDTLTARGAAGWLPVGNPTFTDGGNLLLIFQRPTQKGG
jgi:hypothetical protein